MNATLERPIPMRAHEVLAILDGRKTQTRRVVTPPPAPNAPNDGGTTWVYSPKDGLHVPCGTVGHLTVSEKTGLRCPYGQPGDRLWVRETWAPQCPDMKQGPVMYAADGSVGAHINDGGGGRVWIHHGWVHGHADHGLRGRWFGKPGRWRPSIHMPRWASRLTLEVVSVRVERLHAITEEDARAEGVERWPQPFTQGYCNYEREPAYESVTYHQSALESFASLWRSINGAESWAANPWVWVVEFRRSKEVET